MKQDGTGGQPVMLEFHISRLPENHSEVANRAARLKRNCFAAVFEKYFEAQVSSQIQFKILPRKKGMKEDRSENQCKSERSDIVQST